MKRSLIAPWILSMLAWAHVFAQSPAGPGDVATDAVGGFDADSLFAAGAAPDFGDNGAVASSAAPGEEGFRTLDEEVQDLKQLAIDLNRDLFLLEEELLFPANTQVAVFISMDVGEFFGLDSVEISLDGENVANYLYTEREVDALIRGGVQRLFVGNIRAGEHELVAFFTGKGPQARDYRRGASVVFEKSIGPKYVELTISDRADKQQPEFIVREWE